ncbi:HEPN domain-containing protein [Alcanivorax sp.]|uniref:HEPN domain-containing protein n=1 Tax=Alcanivorax sp. TaxID=1872427 RepID=UPI0026133EA0|nr:HEPN domain-containing protein [Alcanivorax sp.]
MTLRAATESEIEQLNNHLNEAYGFAARLVVPFDHEPVEVEENGTKKTIYSPSEKRRWWVIAFNGYNSQVIELGKVATLTNPKLHFGATFIYGEPDQKGSRQGILFGSHSQIELLANESRKKYEAVDTRELVKLKSYYGLIENDQAAHGKSRFVLELYFSSSSLWVHSGLLTLSLFSIIESIIAHKPRLTETLDSITHQIKNKLNLLSKRFDSSVRHEDYFGEISYPKLWKKLYGLRSDIAHGQKYEFQGTNEILTSLENVNNFLDKVAKELIKLSIEDHELISDLREC